MWFPFIHLGLSHLLCFRDASSVLCSGLSGAESSGSPTVFWIKAHWALPEGCIPAQFPGVSA
jgi:hypothetical protein